MIFMRPSLDLALLVGTAESMLLPYQAIRLSKNRQIDIGHNRPFVDLRRNEAAMTTRIVHNRLDHELGNSTKTGMAQDLHVFEAHHCLQDAHRIDEHRGAFCFVGHTSNHGASLFSFQGPSRCQHAKTGRATIDASRAEKLCQNHQEVVRQNLQFPHLQGDQRTH